ncbi:MAG: FAD-dependent oxidoreductase [Pseudomonadota bacterium]
MTADYQPTEGEHYDVAIVGGGMVGGAAAAGLAQRGQRVVLLEAQQLPTFEPSQPPDLRVSAINLGSFDLLESLGIWPALTSMRLQPYDRLAVWEKHGRCEFDARDLGLDHLGYFVENRLLQLALLQQAQSRPNVTLLTEARVDELELGRSCTLTLTDGRRVHSRWIVAADGAQSQLRTLAGIRTRGWKYAQQVLAISVKTQGKDSSTTWQQFAPTGPMAFLPMYDNHAELIWYHNAQRIADLKKLSDTRLAEEIRDAFPLELDEFELLGRASFPIQRLHATDYSHQNLVLVGDAAHAINPLAGQGVNLGFKDVEALLQLFDESASALDSTAALRNLFKRYEQLRRRDNFAMMSAMDAFYVGFSNQLKPIEFLRNAALDLANRLPVAKRQVLRYAAGIA